MCFQNKTINWTNLTLYYRWVAILLYFVINFIKCYSLFYFFNQFISIKFGSHWSFCIIIFNNLEKLPTIFYILNKNLTGIRNFFLHSDGSTNKFLCSNNYTLLEVASLNWIYQDLLVPIYYQQSNVNLKSEGILMH